MPSTRRPGARRGGSHPVLHDASMPPRWHVSRDDEPHAAFAGEVPWSADRRVPSPIGLACARDRVAGRTVRGRSARGPRRRPDRRRVPQRHVTERRVRRALPLSRRLRRLRPPPRRRAAGGRTVHRVRPRRRTHHGRQYGDHDPVVRRGPRRLLGGERRRSVDLPAQEVGCRGAGVHDRHGERPTWLRAGGRLSQRDEGRLRSLGRHDLVQPRRRHAHLPFPHLRRRPGHRRAGRGDTVHRCQRRAERHGPGMRVQPEQRRDGRRKPSLRHGGRTQPLLRVHQDGRQGRVVRLQPVHPHQRARSRARHPQPRRARALAATRRSRAPARTPAAGPAQDQFGNSALAFAGTAHFAGTDSSAGVVLPANSTLASGQGSFSATLIRAGPQTITATDTATATIIGTLGLTVRAAPASGLALASTATPTAGRSFSFTVSAQDQFGNTDTAYAGTVHFASSDSSAGVVLPADSTLTNGQGAFSATLIKAGSQTITGTDKVTATITGTLGLTIRAANAASLVLDAPGGAKAGQAFNVTVTLKDQYGNVATGYRGTVHFATSDPLPTVALPADYTFTAADGGVRGFQVRLWTPPSQTVSATDTANASLTQFKWVNIGLM